MRSGQRIRQQDSESEELEVGFCVELGFGRCIIGDGCFFFPHEI